MTTPTLSPFHQKILTHAKSATNFKHQPSRILRTFKPSNTQTLRSSARFTETEQSRAAFTLVELLAVITIIGILAGLTLGAAGAVRRHGANSTAKAEVAALQAACDRYFADNNLYPSNTSVDPLTKTNPSTYTAAGPHDQALLRTQTRHGLYKRVRLLLHRPLGLRLRLQLRRHKPPSHLVHRWPNKFSRYE
ncbi:prepilin-type N-terminal cleavage/methylation domain-containing protein [bacterium]|nr:prepilin-type N-terminal cleavage/methylation domain-containing protein [bacterium]